MSELRQILVDEKGKLSASRTLLVGSLVFTAVLIVCDSALWFQVENAVYALLGTIFTGLLMWAAGPRIAEYLGPQVGAVAKGIGSAIRAPRRHKLKDNDRVFADGGEK